MFIREGIHSIDVLGLPEAEQEKIYLTNAVRLMKMSSLR